MKDTGSLDRLVAIMAELRGPGGCPWDREQDHESLRQHLIEEAYEVVDAIDRGSAADLKEELGDLLLQVIFHAEIAKEEGRFDIEDVASDIVDKLVRRHPHIFADTKVSSSQEVIANWEQIKHEEKERQEKGELSATQGVPRSLPALMYACKLQKRAARVGFDWPATGEVVLKVAEELAEIAEARSPEELEDEVGDLLFSAVNLARHLDVNPEIALRKVGDKFDRRFQEVERRAREAGKTIAQMSLEEVDELWEEAKGREKRAGGEDR